MREIGGAGPVRVEDLIPGVVRYRQWTPEEFVGSLEEKKQSNQLAAVA